MATLVFDIETVALDPAVRGDEENVDGLSPFTGEIAAIGVWDVERRQGAVYYQTTTETESWTEGDWQYRPSKEVEMLEDFWEGARSYDVFVTFAGRGFDVPFLNIRSVAHSISPTKELLEHRYLNRQTTMRHVDLQDQLSFYGAFGKKPSLHACCELFGIESSKAAGVSGKDVAELFQTEKFRDIARYNARDVTATAQLYETWYKHLAPASFKNLEL